MKHLFLRAFSLLVVSLLGAACASSHSKPSSHSRSSADTGGEVKTGSYIPRQTKTAQAQGDQSLANSQAKKVKKAKHEKAAVQEEDPNFIPRGGFR
jgi:hypothetical protein